MAPNLPKIRNTPSPEVLERFSYLIGTVRGGTSVLTRAINLHPQMLQFGPTHFMSHVWRYRHKVHERLLRIIIRLPGFYHPCQKTLTDPNEQAEMQRFFNQAIASRDLRMMWAIYPIIKSLDPQNGKMPGEILAWGDKANDFIGMDHVARAFPKGKFIFVTRDPRSSASSMAVRAGRNQDMFQKGLKDSDLIASCIHWTYMTQRILHFVARHPGRCHFLSFEDLVTKPHDTLNRIFRFLGLDVLELNDLSARLATLNYQATNDTDTGKGLDTRPLKRWRKVLNERNLDIVKSITGPTARKAGYDVEGSMGLTNLPRMIRNATGPRQAAVALAKLAALKAMDMTAKPLATD